jgi:tuftelin-interacting protein 11
MLISFQFKAALAEWDPLEDPFMYRDHFRRLSKILGVRTKEDLQSAYRKDGYIERPKYATPYESMLSTLWLPKIRAVINNSWDVHNPTPILSLLDIWSTVLPSHIQANVLSQLILPKLRAAVSAWNPRLQKKKRTPPPHIWVFQWLPYLGTHMDDLLRDMRVKFGVILDTWPITSGVLPGLEAWREVFGPDKLESVLIRHLLPRLAVRLRADFEVNPADQVLEPLEDVFKWASFFRPSTIARLMEAEFFPKWLRVLHMWLTQPNPVFTEVQQWYLFWQDVFPEELRASPAVMEGFRKGLDMVNDALDLGDRAATELSLPTTTTTTASKLAQPPPPPPPKQVEIKESTFRDVVEDWCAEHNVLLVPLRKAHEASGSPLFRITASASGAGGVVCYFRGDVVWCQDRKRKEVWEPMALGKILERVEGLHH